MTATLCAATLSNSYVLWCKRCVMLRFVAVPHIWLCNRSHQNFLIYEKNLVFFISEDREFAILVVGAKQEPNNQGRRTAGNDDRKGSVRPAVGKNDYRGGTTWTGDFKGREVKTGFCRNRSMQTGSSGTHIGWKSGQTMGPNGGSVAMDSGGGDWLDELSEPFFDFEFFTSQIRVVTSPL